VAGVRVLGPLVQAPAGGCRLAAGSTAHKCALLLFCRSCTGIYSSPCLVDAGDVSFQRPLGRELLPAHVTGEGDASQTCVHTGKVLATIMAGRQVMCSASLLEATSPFPSTFSLMAGASSLSPYPSPSPSPGSRLQAPGSFSRLRSD
jgi:hypothetical protein